MASEWRGAAALGADAKTRRLGPGPLILLSAALAISACGLVYELVAGALASYLIGDTITRFSTVIGTYLFAMGVGAWLARFLRGDALARFVEIEIATGVIGGFSAMVLFAAFAANALFQPLLYLLVFGVGALVGIEIPLLLRLLRNHLEFEDLVSRVLSLDYLGALLASLVFPLWFVPSLGLVRTGLAFGMLNVVVAMVTLWFFRDRLRAPALWGAAAISFVALAVAMAGAERFSRHAEERLYRAEVVFAEQSPYQRIALLQRGATTRLYLNGRLQFSSRDEYRYHEALVHPALAALVRPRRVLVLGGGDGLAVREILRHATVESVTLVDIDRQVTDLFRSNTRLTVLNNGALADARVKIVNADAWRWLETRPTRGPDSDPFDAIVMDLPDPSVYALGRLYSAPFFRLLERHLKPEGLIVTQATSPESVREAFWCIVATFEAAGLNATPYHTFLSSFGGWGFVIASRGAYRAPDALPAGLRFLTPAVLNAMFVFSPDIDRVPVAPNRLDTQVLVSYYDRGWRTARE
jgi:spermidine synthase